MAIELVTGKAGVPHVDSEDVGAFNAYSLGSGAYIMSGCKVTAKSANSISIAAGEILWEGRHIRVKGSGESLAVDNGQTGYNRRDLITLNYDKDSNGIESASFKIVKGTATTGTAADPSVKVGSILAGDTSAVIPFARIALSGLSVATPTVLLGSLPSLASLRDSVSSICSKNFTVSQSSTPYGGTLEKVIDISMEGYKPLGIVGFTSNHNGSFPFTECCFIDDTHARVAFMNLVPNQGDWGYSEATITVLYIKQ
ncbi:hypothetical protein [uncultured Senegalimassilia sp.]|jgi:hypothetical protein|uniref:hypothetical protein n=1 Tax=uncultured Senegalimassilia sp. TaxID=1714350 RepID=UPI002056E713|nr:hypothetical protein [uncultured Senegalimassilia sp.]DAM01168.1 MAG TPA: hypothetical protein [Caudoviricetes sp.]